MVLHISLKVSKSQNMPSLYSNLLACFFSPSGILVILFEANYTYVRFSYYFSRMFSVVLYCLFISLIHREFSFDISCSSPISPSDESNLKYHPLEKFPCSSNLKYMGLPLYIIYSRQDTNHYCYLFTFLFVFSDIKIYLLQD